MVKYYAIGKGIEDMSMSQNYETNTAKDVMGDSRTIATKGNKTVSVTPLTINAENPFITWLDTAIERDYELTQLEKKFLFVKTHKMVGTSEATAKPVAWIQSAVVVPDDWAMGNADLQAAATVNLVGTAEFGTVNFDAVSPAEKFIKEIEPPTPATTFYKEGDAARSDFTMYYIHEEA